jgi:hypothetical protein
MREKPSRPISSVAHEGRVAGARQVNDSELVSAAADGSVRVWDVRNTAMPTKFAVPDGG